MNKILGIECAGESLSIALICGDEVLSFRKITQDHGYPEQLVPLVKEVMNAAKVPFSDIDIVASGGGAGSFTGIRIALATAGGISMTTGCKATSISNFLASAFMVPPDERKSADVIVSVLETRRTDFYIQMFDGNLKPLHDPTSLSARDIVFPAGKILLAGDASTRLYNELSDKSNITVVENTTPDAVVIAKVALSLGDNLPPLSPIYVTPAHVTCKS